MEGRKHFSLFEKIGGAQKIRQARNKEGVEDGEWQRQVGRIFKEPKLTDWQWWV